MPGFARQALLLPQVRPQDWQSRATVQAHHKRRDKTLEREIQRRQRSRTGKRRKEEEGKEAKGPSSHGDKQPTRTSQGSKIVLGFLFI